MATTVSTPLTHAAARASDRVFYGGMAVLIAAIVFAGFSPTFYLAPQFDRPAPSPFRVLHGVMFTSWIVLFMVQTSLIAAGRVRVHRRLGIAGTVLAAGMVAIGTVLAIVAAREGRAPPGVDPRVFLVVPLFDMLLFGSLVAAAVYVRRRPQAHKRLMLLATVVLVGAAAARLPAGYHLPGPPVLYGFIVVDALVLMGVLYDVAARHRVHPVYIWGGLAILASEPVRLALGGTPVWSAIANVLVGR
jgi:hypothetical protein